MEIWRLHAVALTQGKRESERERGKETKTQRAQSGFRALHDAKLVLLVVNLALAANVDFESGILDANMEAGPRPLCIGY